MPVLEERTPWQCWGIGGALSVLGDRARLASAWGLGHILSVLGERGSLGSAG